MIFNTFNTIAQTPKPMIFIIPANHLEETTKHLKHLCRRSLDALIYLQGQKSMVSMAEIKITQPIRQHVN